MSSIAQEHSLFKIDLELDSLLEVMQEQIETQGEASAELMEEFQRFCEAQGEKVDRIGRFIRMMEARTQFCKSEASRLQDRARTCDRRVAQTKSMVMYYLKCRELRKIEGQEFTLRIQKNSQDSVRFVDETQIPMSFRKVEAFVDGQLWERIVAALPIELKHQLIASIREALPSNEAIKQAREANVIVPGAEVYRGDHLRVA
jgi:hypothetical protein